MFADCTYIIVSLLEGATDSTMPTFQEGSHQKLFFHLKEAKNYKKGEDERSARLDDKT